MVVQHKHNIFVKIIYMQKLVLALIIVLAIACKPKTNAPDVSHIKVDVQIQRFENDLFDTTTKGQAKIDALNKKYSTIATYFYTSTGISDALATGLKPEIILNKYTGNLKPLFDSALLKYKKIDKLTAEFKKAFQYYKYYFPKASLPQIFTTVNLLSDDQKLFSGVEYTKDTLLIHLQMFLGKDFSFYDPQLFSDYFRVRFDEPYIVRNSLMSMLKEQAPAITSDAPLVEQMIDQGKRIYILKQLLPEKDDHILINYTKTQLADCNGREKMIYSFFLDNNYLFNSDVQNIRDFCGEGPFTKELGTDSPGNIGAFVGWQIVKKFMEKNPKLSLPDLLQKDAKAIYNEAKYKP